MPLVPAEHLERLVTDIFVAAGTPDDLAQQVAHSLVEANLAGHDSHGVLRVASYLDFIRQGRIQPASRPETVQEGPATALVDGRWGFGQVTARYAMALAVEKARAAGVAAVAAVRCNHIGRLGEWTEMAAAGGVVGFCCVAIGGGPTAAAPYGGARRAFGTNPLSFGIPVDHTPAVVSDFATTVVAEGKLRYAREKGVPLPEGWILDKEGRPSRDPADFYAGGTILPFGGHKGYALALVVELLSLALTGADAAPQPDGWHSGALFLCLNPAAFRSIEAYDRGVTAILQRVKAVPPAPGFEEVLLPGEPERRTRAERSRDGIPLPDATWETLRQCAAELGVAPR